MRDVTDGHPWRGGGFGAPAGESPRRPLDSGQPPRRASPVRSRSRADYLRTRQARRFAIVSVEEARSLTGLELWQLEALGAEPLVRTFADGRREQALRLPGEFVPGDPRRL